MSEPRLHRVEATSSSPWESTATVVATASSPWESGARLPSGPSLGLSGLHAAIQRLAAAFPGAFEPGGQAAVSGALGEAMFWIAALDDDSRRSIGGYDAQRDASEGGRTVGGLVYARNRLGHGLYMATAVVYAPRSPADGMVPSEGFRWAALDELPAPDPGHPETRGRDVMYAERVAGEPLAGPLELAHRWVVALIQYGGPNA